MLDHFRTQRVRGPLSLVRRRFLPIEQVSLNEPRRGHFSLGDLDSGLCQFQSHNLRRRKPGTDGRCHVALPAADIDDACSFSSPFQSEQRKDQLAAVVLSGVPACCFAVVLPVPVPIVASE
jgi:hypothetical protein